MLPRLPRHLRSSLAVVEFLAIATFLRSVAFDRWITVVASLVLLGGAVAAQRGRTWGVALAFTMAATFATTWAIGIAPFWFALVGLSAAIPFMKMFRSFARFDRGAAILLAGLAATLGAGGALAWKEWAVSLFHAFPILRPSFYPHHGILLLTMMALATAANRLFPRSATLDELDEPDEHEQEEPARVRVGERVRVEDPLEAESLASLDEELAPPVRAAKAEGGPPR